jgi:hypothetical protein
MVIAKHQRFAMLRSTRRHYNPGIEAFGVMVCATCQNNFDILWGSATIAKWRWWYWVFRPRCCNCNHKFTKADLWTP